MTIEACTENFLESLNAERNGATRIELCENLSKNGTTPSYGTVKICCNELNIPIFAMIRPRDSFILSPQEIDIMLTDIISLKQLNVAGFVFGVLQADGKNINYPVMKKLINACGDRSIIIHKAFDELSNPVAEVEKLKSIGITHILSSAKQTNVFKGKEHFHHLYQECCKYSMQLTIAGKITKHNLTKVQQEIPAHAYHGRAIVGL